MQNLTSETYAKETKKGKVVVDFWAPWCGPCKLMAPVLDASAKENKDISFFKLNVDDNPDIASEMGVMSIPTLIFLKDGDQVDSMVGYSSKDTLNKKITKAFG